MSRSRDLEVRLKEWGEEYRRVYTESGYGTNWLASLMLWHGPSPSGLGQSIRHTPADEVQEAVDALEKQRRGKQLAQVLRAEYISSLPRDKRLRKLGLRTDRYSQLLRLAKVHVAGWLRIPFDEPLPPDEQVGMLECITSLD